MNQELEQKIIKVAPYMFEYDGHKDITKSLLSFGFCCGGGWFNLIKDLVTKLKEVDTKKIIRVVQVKEKYGTLRFYIDRGTDEIYKLINEAEEKSYETCEECGDIATKSTRGWIKRLCEKCFNERN